MGSSENTCVLSRRKGSVEEDEAEPLEDFFFGAVFASSRAIWAIVIGLGA